MKVVTENNVFSLDIKVYRDYPFMLSKFHLREVCFKSSAVPPRDLVEIFDDIRGFVCRPGRGLSISVNYNCIDVVGGELVYDKSISAYDSEHRDDSGVLCISLEEIMKDMLLSVADYIRCREEAARIRLIEDGDEEHVQDFNLMMEVL